MTLTLQGHLSEAVTLIVLAQDEKSAPVVRRRHVLMALAALEEARVRHRDLFMQRTPSLDPEVTQTLDAMESVIGTGIYENLQEALALHQSLTKPQEAP